MFLYLVQHAEALTKEEDASRSLSDKGVADIRRVAGYAGKNDIRVGRIFHSGKMRSLQTAQVLDECLKSGSELIQAEGLAPQDDPAIWFDRLTETREDLMLVGHLPHLGGLAALLLCGDREANIIDFRMGGIVCLKRSDDGRWAVEWMIVPEMAG
ncbi:MAG: phosphohistidine phosphatase SixA [Nitrospirae bacterium]|nr:phosphohistidine phosphatase SixA [Nitrospirota bacterium]